MAHLYHSRVFTKALKSICHGDTCTPMAIVATTETPAHACLLQQWSQRLSYEANREEQMNKMGFT